MPGILDGCILIMSKAGTGTAMFSMGENENEILSRLFGNRSRTSVLGYAKILGLTLINECMRVHRHVHGAAREIDSMWAELDCVRDGLEVRRWSSSHGDRFYCLGLAWRCPPCRDHPGMKLSSFGVILCATSITLTFSALRLVELNL